MKERRTSQRECIDILINKHVDGFPYACRALDISKGGILIRRIHEPQFQEQHCSLEIGLPGVEDRIWIWARTVHSRGKRQALEFIGMSEIDRSALTQFVDSLSQAA